MRRSNNVAVWPKRSWSGLVPTGDETNPGHANVNAFIVIYIYIYVYISVGNLSTLNTVCALANCDFCLCSGKIIESSKT